MLEKHYIGHHRDNVLLEPKALFLNALYILLI